MYKVKVLVKSYIDGARRNPGDVITVSGLDGRVECIKDLDPPKAKDNGKKDPGPKADSEGKGKKETAPTGTAGTDPAKAPEFE